MNDSFLRDTLSSMPKGALRAICVKSGFEKPSKQKEARVALLINHPDRDLVVSNTEIVLSRRKKRRAKRKNAGKKIGKFLAELSAISIYAMLDNEDQAIEKNF